MIRRLEPTWEEDFHRVLRHDPIFGARLHSQYEIYGAAAEIWLQYVDGTPAAVVQGKGPGSFEALAGPAADLEELGQMLRSAGLRYLHGSPRLCETLTDIGPLNSAPAMEYRGEPFPAEVTDITDAPKLRDVYDLLAEVNHTWFPGESPWEGWYPWVSHLIRHQLGCICGIYQDSSLLCTGTITAVGETHALIGSVATHPSVRGQGLAGRITRHLVNCALERDKVPSLLCAESSLARYYSRLGFVEVGVWAEVEAPSPIIRT